MALSPLRSKKALKNRSLSLPSKLQHPAITRFNQSLSKITTSPSMDNTLSGLKGLHCNIDDLLVLPHIQHIISQARHETWVDRVLVDAHIRLLDACTAAKDAVSQTKHDVQQLLSALRRKDANDIQSYRVASRKNSKKVIQKALKELKSLKSAKQNDFLLLEKDQETVAVVYMIKEAESVTIAMFENLVSNVIGGNSNVQSCWSSLVSKKLIIPTKKVPYQCEETDPSRLKEMESNIQILEQELECLFRQLIKTRVILLNILSH